MTNFITWFMTSSADPEKVSLTLKSLGALAVLFGLNATVVGDLQNQLATLITGIGMVISSAVALVGLTRKIHLGRWSAH